MCVRGWTNECTNESQRCLSTTCDKEAQGDCVRFLFEDRAVNGRSRQRRIPFSQYVLLCSLPHGGHYGEGRMKLVSYEYVGLWLVKLYKLDDEGHEVRLHKINHDRD